MEIRPTESGSSLRLGTEVGTEEMAPISSFLSCDLWQIPVDTPPICAGFNVPFLPPRQPGRDKSTSQNICQPVLPTAESGFLPESPQHRDSTGRRLRSARLGSWLNERDRSDKGKHVQDTSCTHANGLWDGTQLPRKCTEQ